MPSHTATAIMHKPAWYRHGDAIEDVDLALASSVVTTEVFGVDGMIRCVDGLHLAGGVCEGGRL